MNILDEIIANTKSKLEVRKKEYPLEKIKAELKLSAIKKLSFKNNLINKDQAIIAEIKKASPSAGIISKDFDPIAKAEEYEKFGASALSVLTEEDYFLGSIQYLKDIRKKTNLPILRKDFIVDIYQIYESKVIGADCILLIASALSDSQLNEFTALADDLELDYLIEVHDELELNRVDSFSNAIIGVNNRNLKTFKVDIQNSIKLRNLFIKDNIFVSESGIRNQKDIDMLLANDIHIFLIGESLMKGDFF
tara:strand:+ start:12127 stop:12876 length:750 start_codon:yes stop_codon:yes gene_type:complete